MNRRDFLRIFTITIPGIVFEPFYEWTIIIPPVSERPHSTMGISTVGSTDAIGAN